MSDFNSLAFLSTSALNEALFAFNSSALCAISDSSLFLSDFNPNCATLLFKDSLLFWTSYLNDAQAVFNSLALVRPYGI